MTTVEVLVDERGHTRSVGRAHFTRDRGQISTTFYYDPGYLADDGVAIDPALPLVSGAQHQRELIRAFADSAPGPGPAPASIDLHRGSRRAARRDRGLAGAGAGLRDVGRAGP
ncbi:HipA N-terminal domain-containing protein [Nocardia harenae]|uniref:HipA N-terminal domain-containing protein n=1 Tax=Nocardia harenae TaxID=358707 RepID=UPI000AE24E7E|nr:HipA N-terminal domain-containing protein [Nocardia harenae]